ncbi:hypothetical protein SteCoe_1352 [Stentor coeruleus]|uniref:Uncharacterized protein n=1 Tax=Stentor coeruleus TaxID=5963 RepID=A0A1R2D209_9CILI|nr:hypothetical protein SteCoe_1352 [Stentor coeruleus]
MRYKITYDSFVIEYNKQAIQYIEKNELDQAISLMKTADNIMKTENVRNMNLLKSLTYYSYGIYNMKKRKILLSIKYFLKSLDHGKNGINILTLSKTHLHLSQIYLKSSQYSKSLQHALLALKACKTSTKELFEIFESIGNSYKHLGNHLEAMKYFRTGCELSNKLYGKNSEYEVKLAYEHEKLSKINGIKSRKLCTPTRTKSSEQIFNSVPRSLTPVLSPNPSNIPINRTKGHSFINKFIDD